MMVGTISFMGRSMARGLKRSVMEGKGDRSIGVWPEYQLFGVLTFVTLLMRGTSKKGSHLPEYPSMASRLCPQDGEKAMAPDALHLA